MVQKPTPPRLRRLLDWLEEHQPQTPVMCGAWLAVPAILVAVVWGVVEYLRRQL